MTSINQSLLIGDLTEKPFQKDVPITKHSPEAGPTTVQGSRQTFVPVKDFNKSNKGWNSAAGVYVVYSKNIRRITLQRILCSILVFAQKEFRVKDLLVLYDNLLYLQDMAEKDENFKNKFGSALEALTNILKNSRMTHTPTRAGFNKIRDEMIVHLHDFLIPERNLKHTLVYYKGKYEVRQGYKLGTPTANLPIKRYIGVNYRDKGTARNTAIDGTPTWQEYCRMRLWENLT